MRRLTSCCSSTILTPCPDNKPIPQIIKKDIGVYIKVNK